MVLAPVTLAGRHVVLEPLHADHVEALWVHAQEHDLWAYMLFDVRSKADLARWVEQRRAAQAAGTALAFVQRDARTGEPFGSTSLFDHDAANRKVEVGHTWLGARYRRTAANTEAKLLLLRHAFETLGLERVQLKCDVRNVRSQRAIERLGATREGVLRSWLLLPEGQGRDTVMYSILAREWPAVQAGLERRLATPR